MRNLFIVTFLALAVSIVNAQPPQRGGGGRRPGGPPSEGMRRSPSERERQLTLEVFPQIPDLTLEQRAKVGSVLAKEYKDLAKQLKKKREIEIKSQENPSDRDSEKERKKIEKIDNKILSIKEKTNKKVKKEMSDEQYAVFLAKREEFKFGYQQDGRRDERTPGERDNRPQRPRPGERGF